MKNQKSRISAQFSTWGFLLVSGLLIFPSNLSAQWATNGPHTFHTNPGNVGIGTTTPAQLLHLFGNGATTVARVRFGSSGVAEGYQIGFSGPGNSNVELWNFENTDFIFATGNAERMRINAAGNVGIGTSAPVSMLHLRGNQVSTVARMRFGGAGIANGFQVGLSGGGATPNVELWNFENTDFIFATNNAERLRVAGNGNIGIGTSAPATKLHVVGDITVTGNIAAKYQDVAEWVPVSSDVAPGTVVVLDPASSNQVMASHKQYDTSVAGVVSAQPGLILGESASNKRMIATTGRVMVRVDASKFPVRIGDLLVSSDRPGYAMKSTPVELGGISLHRPGTIIGKALDRLDSGEGEILVLLSLQ